MENVLRCVVCHKVGKENELASLEGDTKPSRHESVDVTLSITKENVDAISLSEVTKEDQTSEGDRDVARPSYKYHEPVDVTLSIKEDDDFSLSDKDLAQEIWDDIARVSRYQEPVDVALSIKEDDDYSDKEECDMAAMCSGENMVFSGTLTSGNLDISPDMSNQEAIRHAFEDGIVIDSIESSSDSVKKGLETREEPDTSSYSRKTVTFSGSLIPEKLAISPGMSNEEILKHAFKDAIVIDSIGSDDDSSSSDGGVTFISAPANTDKSRKDILKQIFRESVIESLVEYRKAHAFDDSSSSSQPDDEVEEGLVKFSGSLIPKLPTRPEFSEDLAKKAFEEAIIIDWESDDSDVEWEVGSLIHSEDRIHRATLLKNLFLNNLSMEKVRFMSIFQEKTSSTLSYIDSECAELYLVLQKSVRFQSLLSRESYNRSTNNLSLTLVTYITDRIFFYLSGLCFVHKRRLNKNITINSLSMNKMYDMQSSHIEKYMTSIVSKKKDGLLISMEKNPHGSYKRLFSVCPRSKMSTRIEKHYIQPAIDSVNADLSAIHSLAERRMKKISLELSSHTANHITKVSRAISMPCLLIDSIVLQHS